MSDAQVPSAAARPVQLANKRVRRITDSRNISTVNIYTGSEAWRSQRKIDIVSLAEVSMANRRTTRTRKELPKPYHHGALREALLAAAARILERDGSVGLTLRAAAREVGTSHAAPKNHFGDLAGLLSELAAVGFDRFTYSLLAAPSAQATPKARLNAIGHAYVEFAITNPGLFQLMFRSERLDTTRPALRDAVEKASRVLTGAVADAYPKKSSEGPAPSTAPAELVRAWAMVHGYAMLLLDGRLDRILRDQTSPSEPMILLDAILALD
jgi:AcrR family transcriptional regulator